MKTWMIRDNIIYKENAYLLFSTMADGNWQCYMYINSYVHI